MILSVLASVFGNMGFTAFWTLQVQRNADPLSLTIAAITGLTGALVAVFFIYRKEVKERNASNELHAKNIQNIYESVVKETNVNISNNNRLTDENIEQVKELRETIQRLPKELREILKDK